MGVCVCVGGCVCVCVGGGGGGRGGVSEIFILVEGHNFVSQQGGGFSHSILKENLKLHNPSKKSIFRITSLTSSVLGALEISVNMFYQVQPLRFLIFPLFFKYCKCYCTSDNVCQTS